MSYQIEFTKEANKIIAKYKNFMRFQNLSEIFFVRNRFSPFIYKHKKYKKRCMNNDTNVKK